MASILARPGDEEREAHAATEGRWADARLKFGWRVATRYGWALVSPAATLVVSLLTSSITSRHLGPSGFGHFVVAVAVSAVLAVAMGMGMADTLVRFTAGMPQNEAEPRRRIRAVVWRLVGMSVLLLGALFLLITTLAPGLLASWVPPGTSPWILATAVGTVLTELASAEAQTVQRFGRLFVANGVLAAGRLLSVVVAVMSGHATVEGVLAAYGLASVLAGGGAAAFFLRQGGSIFSGLQQLGGQARELLNFGLPVMGSAYVVALMGYADSFVAARFLSPAQLGIYAAASRLTTLQSRVITGLTIIALPVAASAVASGKVRRFTRRALGLGLLAGIGTTLIIAVAAPIVISLIYGHHFHASARLFVILSVGIMLNFPGNPLSQLLYAIGRPRVLFYIHVVQLLALAGALPFAAARFGVVGIAAAWSGVNILAICAVMILAITMARPKRAPA